MRKLIRFLIVVAIIGGGLFFGLKYLRDKNREAERLEKIKEDMYIEIVYEDLSGCTTKFKLSNQEKNYDDGCAQTELKVRLAPRADSDILGTAIKGEIYKVVEIDETDPMFVWFRIVYQKNYKDKYQEGYIAQPRSSTIKYVEANGITFDYSSPTLGFDQDTVNFDSIDDINYNDLRVWDDQPGYVITHEVYIEREPVDMPPPQYWIKYTVTDKKGKTISKVRRVIFKYPPSDSRVKDFKDIRK